MNSRLCSLLILGATLLASFVLVVHSQTAYATDYISNFERIPAVSDRPPRVATWARTPTVIVCEYAPVTETQIKAAVDVWKNLGYRFFKTQFKYAPLNKCLNTSPKGYIIIHLVTSGVKFEDDTLAQTQFYVDNEKNEIEWAIIYMRSDIRETVLEHEIGHALGFLHFNKINHLMNSKWTQGGWDTAGLRQR
jgi:hypothetical protein